MSGPWDDLVGSAISGTRRRPAPVERWLADLGAGHGDSEPGLLDAAALLTVGRAAAPELVAAPALPTPVTEPRLVLPARVFTDLRGLAAQDVIRAVVQRGLAAAPSSLPRLIEQAAAGTLDRALVRELAGDCGRLLAELNPDWVFLRDEPVTGDGWLDPDPTTRLTWLAELRRTDPEQGREYVARALQTKETPRFRARTLELLEAEPQPADLDLLESALEAKAGEVRRQAVQTLQAHPDSAFHRRMVQRLRAWFRIDDAGLAQVCLPASLTPADERDGLDLTDPRRVMGQVARSVPLAEWAEWGSPERVLTELRRADLPRIVEGMLHRLPLDADAAWVRPLLATGKGEPRHFRGLLTPDEIHRHTLAAFAQIDANGACDSWPWLWSVLKPLPDGYARPALDALTRIHRRHAGLPLIDALIDRCRAAELREMLTLDPQVIDPQARYRVVGSLNSAESRDRALAQIATFVRTAPGGTP